MYFDSVFWKRAVWGTGVSRTDMLEISTETWREILHSVKTEFDVTDVAFRTWLEPLSIHDVRDNTVVILVTTGQMGIDYITKKYLYPLKVAVAEITGTEYEIGFILPEDAKEEELRNTRKAKVEIPGIDAKLNMTLHDAGLNPKYTFENFVVGSNNKFAHSAAVAVAESPGRMYNPLFIYGGPGLGKTHLMNAIAAHIIMTQPEKSVCYVSSETFTNQLIDALRNSSNISLITSFRHRYRNIDVLLIDDIQFIIGKESTQEEFFHTFNDLIGREKQIIISSDRPPKEFDTLDERLKTRFASGLLADIQIPDYETRMAILQKKAETEHYLISNDVLQYIASNIRSNIRELEGALTKLIALSRVENREITPELAENALKEFISPDHKREITADLILSTVAEHFNLSVQDLKGSKRNSEIVQPRHMAMYLCRNMTNLSLHSIGDVLGKRDHSTIMHGIEKVDNDIKQYEDIRRTIDVLKNKINPSD